MENLTCRFYASHFPKVGDVVMINVLSAKADEAGVSLVEYDNIGGKIYEIGCVVGRIEAAVVESVSPMVLSRNVSFDDRKKCEQSYMKARFVQSVLRDVAKDLKSDLLAIHKVLDWPSYDILTNRRVSQLLPIAASPTVRKSLSKSLQKIKLESWRIMNPWILSSSTLVQGCSDCWAHAILRQFEALLKINDRIPMDSYLSVADLKSKTPMTPKGGLDSFEDVRDALTYIGIRSTNPKGPREVFKARDMEILYESDFSPEDWDALLGLRVMAAPITVSALWFPSYESLAGNQIFKPSDEEWADYEEDWSKFSKTTTHSLLLTGAGTDELEGTPYLELLDSYGDVANGDRGYLRFARYPYSQTLFECVELKI